MAADPWSSGAISWLVSRILDRLTKLKKAQQVTRSEHERLKAKVLDLVETNDRLNTALQEATAKRLSLQADNRILKAKLKAAEKKPQRPDRKKKG